MKFSGITKSGMGISLETISNPNWGSDMLGVVRTGGKLKADAFFPPKGSGKTIMQRSLLKW